MDRPETRNINIGLSILGSAWTLVAAERAYEFSQFANPDRSLAYGLLAGVGLTVTLICADRLRRSK